MSYKKAKTFFVVTFCAVIFLVVLAPFIWYWACAEANNELKTARARILDDGGVLGVKRFAELYPQDLEYFDGAPQDSTMAYLLSNQLPGIESELHLINVDITDAESYAKGVARLEEQRDAVQRLKAMLAQPLTSPDDVLKLIGAKSSFLEIKTPGMLSTRKATKLLSWDALVSHQNGNSDEALETYEDFIYMGRHISQCPSLIGCMVGVTMVGLSQESLPEIIIDAPFSDEAIESFNETLDSFHVEEYLKLALQGEILFLRKVFARMRNGETVTGVRTQEEIRRYRLGIAYYDFIFSHDEATALDIVQDFIDRLDDPYDNDNVDSSEERYSWRTPISKTVIPGMFRSRLPVVQTRLYLTQLRVALSINRYHQATGDYPETVDQLVPEYLDTIPINPLSNAPIALEYIETLSPNGELRIDKEYSLVIIEFKINHSDTAQGVIIQ